MQPISKTKISQAKTKAKAILLTEKLKTELFPKKIKCFSLAWIIYVVILVIILYAGYFAYTLLGIKNEAKDLAEIKVDKTYIKKLNTLEDFGTPATSDEPGFGRENPFGGI